MISRYLGRPVEIPDHIKKKEPLGGEAFRRELQRTNDLVIGLLSDLTDADLPREIILPDGSKSTVGWVVFHLCEHEIHHRAQLKMVLRLQGIDTSGVKL